MFGNRRTRREAVAWTVATGAIGLACLAFAADEKAAAKYAAQSTGTRWLDGPSGVTVKMLYEQANFGGAELEFGEITFPAGYKKSPPHRHAHVEIFYVISGKLGHEVNGEEHVLTPGMAGIVRPGDTVAHSNAADEPARALVIWTPAGEADALVKSGVFKVRAGE